MREITICGKAADVVCFIQSLYPIAGLTTEKETTDEEIEFMISNNPPGFVGYFKGTKIYTSYTDDKNIEFVMEQ